MATLAALNTAVTGTAIDSSKYNDNMTRIRASVNSVAAAQLASNSVITAKILDANVTEAKLAAAVQAKLLGAAGTLSNGTSDVTVVENGIITMDVAGVESFAFDANGILTLAKQSAVTLTKSANQAFSAGVTTKITFDGTDFDQQSEFDNANDRITVKTAGVYIVLATFGITSSDTVEVITARIYKNGANPDRARARATGNSTGNDIAICTAFDLVANDYLELFGHYTSSSRSATTACSLTVIKVA